MQQACLGVGGHATDVGFLGHISVLYVYLIFTLSFYSLAVVEPLNSLGYLIAIHILHAEVNHYYLIHRRLLLYSHRESTLGKLEPGLAVADNF